MKMTGCSLMLDMNDMSYKISVLTLNYLMCHLATIHFLPPLKLKKKNQSSSWLSTPSSHQNTLVLYPINEHDHNLQF